MHNWSLLLLACLAVFEPIATFSERSLVHGREQCSGARDQSLLRDTRLSLYGDRTGKPEQRLLNYRDGTRDVRENRRYEVRDGISTKGRVVKNRAREDTRGDFTRLAREEQRRTRDSRERLLSSDRESRRIAARDLDNRDRVREISTERSSRAGRDVRYDERFAQRSSQNRRNSEERMSRLLDQRTADRARDMRRSEERRQTRSVLKTESEGEIRFNRVSSRDETRMPEVTRRDERRTRRESELRGSARRSSERSMNREISRRGDEGVRSGSARNLREESRVTRRDARDREETRHDSRRAAERIDEPRLHRDENRVFRADERFALRDARARSTEREVRDRTNLRSEAFQRRSESRDARSSERRVDKNRRNVASRFERTNDLATRNIRQSDLRRTERDLARRESGDNRRTNERDNRSDVRRSQNVRMEIRDKADDATSRFRYIETKAVENTEATSAFVNWPYFFYTLQGIYICSILVHVFGDKGTGKKKIRSFNFWASSPKMIKMD